jgi:hypothetical protein
MRIRDQRDYQAAYRAKQRLLDEAGLLEDWKEKRRRQRASGQSKTLWLIENARARAKEKNVPFSIKAKDLVAPDYCPVFGTPLIYTRSRHIDRSRLPRENLPSIDRTIPELGYIPGNVAIISLHANTIKSMGTAEEHRAIASYIDRMTARPRAMEDIL